MIGWECPKCGRCYSPYTAQCVVCGQYTSSAGMLTVLPQGELSCPACGQNRNMPSLTGCSIGTHYGTYTASLRG